MVYQQTQNIDSKFVEMDSRYCFGRKLWAKNEVIISFLRIFHFLTMFLSTAFFRNIILSPFYKILNLHKVMRFLIPQKKFSEFFFGHFSTFCKYWMHMPKNGTFSHICKKEEKNFLQISIHLSLNLIKFFILKGSRVLCAPEWQMYDK